ncbi:aminotransferase class V-fold PLP-dependent enzyme [Candidatus Woesearchaeota archaeon]|nr:aminotransferase class V-fold PLP-dependent enzyme [Candidatus Woesearchaeota archaeon]
MISQIIPIAKPLIGEEEKKAVIEVLSSGMLAQGKIVAAFEEAFAEFIGVKHAIATSNGTTALHAALLGLGIGHGDEVITTAFSFIATANAIKMCGATPVFVDIDERTFNIDPLLIERAITPRTKAILPVHLFGLPAEMGKIMDIAKKYNLLVVEDACQAHGAEYKRRKVGSFGIGCFSFYPTKNMTTSEGGMVTTNDDIIAARIRLLISHGSSKKYNHDFIGYNYRMTDVAAAIGLEQLRKLTAFNLQRVHNALFYDSSLRELSEITLPTKNDGHVYHQYSILVKQRDYFQKYLADRRIESVAYYPIPIHKQAAYKEYEQESFPVAERIATTILSLPIGPYLTEDDRQYVVRAIRDFFEKYLPDNPYFSYRDDASEQNKISRLNGRVKIMDKEKVELVLGRKEYNELVLLDINSLKNERILITGANGSIGTSLLKRLQGFNILSQDAKIDFLSTDIEGNHTYMNVTDFNNVFAVVNKYHPTIIVNIAGAKHAPEGEHETWKTLSINTIGTKNLIDCAPKDCRIILASTCKSANPEIVYGASKLIAERMTLNSGGSVARYFNVVESSGNVFEIWRSLPENEPIRVAPTCQRHFISLDEAAGLILYTMMAKPGRYIVNSGHLLKMGDVAERLYPHREKIIISPRRGDRLTEKFLASSEDIESYHLGTSVIKVKNIHDKGSDDDHK